MHKTRRKVLLVEDRWSFLTLWKSEFERHGFEVEFARDRVLAMQRLASEKYGAVVIDNNLDEGVVKDKEGGLVVAHWIRNHDKKDIRDLPLVFAVVNPSEEFRRESDLLTANGKNGALLVKPFASRELRTLVERLLVEGGSDV